MSTLLLAGVASALAQSYSVGWFKIAGGGGTSTNGQYAVSGTVGQPDSGLPMTNGPYAATAGFWALPQAVQTPEAPTLRIQPAVAGFAMISWSPASPGYSLEQSPGLSPAQWTPAPSGTNNPVTLPVAGAARIYRLVKPSAL